MALFNSIATTEAKLEQGVIEPSELHQIIQTHAMFIAEAIEEDFGQELHAHNEQARRAKKSLDDLLQSVKLIDEQNGVKTVATIIDLLKLSATARGELGVQMRRLVDGFEIEVWLLRRLKDPACEQIDFEGGDISDISVLEKSVTSEVPKTGSHPLIHCAQVLAANGTVARKMCGMGYLEIFHDFAINSDIDEDMRATAIAALANLMRSCLDVAGSFALSKPQLLNQVRLLLCSSEIRARSIALRFLHVCVVGADEDRTQVVMANKLAVGVGHSLDIESPPDMHRIALEVINALAYSGPAFRHKLLRDDRELLERCRKFARWKWKDELRKSSELEIKIRRIAGSCVAQLEPMAKELQNFAVLKAELTILKEKAAAEAGVPSTPVKSSPAYKSVPTSPLDPRQNLGAPTMII